MVVPDSAISDIVPADATFWGAGLCFLRWQSLQIDSLLFDWELREELNNVQEGMIFVTAQVCQGFSPLLV
jgi:hypothetical protein